MNDADASNQELGRAPKQAGWTPAYQPRWTPASYQPATPVDGEGCEKALRFTNSLHCVDASCRRELDGTMTTPLTQSHAVSSIVAGWLSKSKVAPAPATAAADAPTLTSLFAPRPERLGLGAKFVPHSAALNVNEQQLSKKLKASQQPPTQQKRQVPPQGSKRREQTSNDSDEDEESRTSAFRLRKGSSGASRNNVQNQKKRKRPAQ